MNRDIYILAFLSRVYADSLDGDFVTDLLKNKDFLHSIGKDAYDYFATNDLDFVLDQLNTEFSSIFLMNAHPIESSIIDNKDEILVGLQNPVMQFYFQNGYEINLVASKIQTPDHIAIELAFLQNLAQRGEKDVMKQFLDVHMLEWAISYLLSLKVATSNLFYRDLFDFTAEYLVALREELEN